MPMGIHVAGVVVLVLLCGGFLAVVACAVGIVWWMMRGTIRQEVRRTLAEERAQEQANQR